MVLTDTLFQTAGAAAEKEREAHDVDVQIIDVV